jgi:hypothetical protein
VPIPSCRLPDSGAGLLGSSPTMELDMTPMRNLILMMCVTGLASFALSQDTTPRRITAADAKNHIGETAIVCGKVVGTSLPKYGIAGRGKPVSFYLDQPEANPVFYFIAFGAQPGGPAEVIAAYQDKRVCVTGKIDTVPSGGPPFIMAADRSQIKTEAAGK